MRLNSPEELADLTAICRTLSKDGLQDVINHAIARYVREQGITREDLRKLYQVPRKPISDAFVSAAFEARDPAFQNFLRRVTTVPIAGQGKRRAS